MVENGSLKSAEARRRIIFDAELSVLRAMCQGTPEGRVWSEGIRLLAGYPFQDSTHQIVFSTLRELNSDVPETIRALLLERITRKGFPDVDVNTYFQPHGLTSAAAASMMQAILATALGDRLSAPL